MARAVYKKFQNSNKTVNTMLIGAGEAGRMIIDEISNNSSNFDNKIVCVVDDDKTKVGSYIRGIKIRSFSLLAVADLSAQSFVVRSPKPSRSFS